MSSENKVKNWIIFSIFKQYFIQYKLLNMIRQLAQPIFIAFSLCIGIINHLFFICCPKKNGRSIHLSSKQIYMSFVIVVLYFDQYIIILNLMPETKIKIYHDIQGVVSLSVDIIWLIFSRRLNPDESAIYTPQHIWKSYNFKNSL